MAAWNLISQDHRYSIDVQALDNGALNGTLSYEGTTYAVAGGWDASYSLPGRNFSAFALSGSTSEAAPTFLSATGIMTGPGTAPTRIDIQIDLSASSDGSVRQYKGVLLSS